MKQTIENNNSDIEVTGTKTYDIKKIIAPYKKELATKPWTSKVGSKAGYRASLLKPATSDQNGQPNIETLIKPSLKLAQIWDEGLLGSRSPEKDVSDQWGNTIRNAIKLHGGEELYDQINEMRARTRGD